jgi:hypothetical protein
MLGTLLPRRIDNSYSGHRVALWLFAAIVFVKTSIGLSTIFNGRYAATTADGILLDSFSPAGTQAFLTMFAVWGLAQAMIGLLCIVVLFRYRGLVPFMFALLLLEHLARRLIFFVMPVARATDAPGLWINLALAAMLLVGLLLSLRNQKPV